jgi:hypothetical protein
MRNVTIARWPDDRRWGMRKKNYPRTSKSINFFPKTKQKCELRWVEQIISMYFIALPFPSSSLPPHLLSKLKKMKEMKEIVSSMNDSWMRVVSRVQIIKYKISTHLKTHKTFHEIFGTLCSNADDRNTSVNNLFVSITLRSRCSKHS